MQTSFKALNWEESPSKYTKKLKKTVDSNKKFNQTFRTISDRMTGLGKDVYISEKEVYDGLNVYRAQYKDGKHIYSQPVFTNSTKYKTSLDLQDFFTALYNWCNCQQMLQLEEVMDFETNLYRTYT